MRLIFALFLYCYLTTESAFAGTEASLSTPAMLRFIWGLLLVFGLLLIVYTFVKKKFSFLSVGTSKKGITIIETCHLMPKKSLCLVKVRGQEYLLGIGSDQINLIAAIPPAPPTITHDNLNFAASLAAAEADKK
jgi:flagellar protein FliO/FliZ